VIVVLAVLATISVVAYNGVQQRAKASSVATAVNAYIKAIRLYKVDNGKFPIPYVGVVSRACLASDASQYPADSPYPAGSCEYENGTSYSSYDAGTMSALSPYLSSSPKFPVITFKTDYYSSGFTIRGVEYYYYNNQDKVRLRFVVSGSSCPIGGDENSGIVPSTNNTTTCYYDIQ
jgi:type II secretory pathway pseudopilin PulG